MFYGGKGGVGKTTCAAARAVRAANSGKRVLVVSTDPAHSLGDALGMQLSARPRLIRRGLKAVELDAPRAFARWLNEHGRALGDVLEHGTWLDREDVDALLNLSIPGIDELVGMLEIVRLASPPGSGRTRRSYDAIVIDTAPTGHTLRLLAAPEAVGAVASVLDALQEQHRLIREQLARVGRPEATDRLIALLADQARDTAALLRDPRQTTFEWVTLPEDLSFAETEDALANLDRAGIVVHEVIVNRVIPDGAPCALCDRRRSDERRVIEKIRRRFGGGRTIRIVPAQLHEPQGVKALEKIGRFVSPGGDVGRVLPPPLARSSGELRRTAAAFGEGGWTRRSGGSDRRASVSDSDPGEPTLLSGGSKRTRPADRGSGDAPESLPAFQGAQLLFFGGKGGVGKTTVAAAAALRLARAEPARDVLLLSTDPAHSLGDVFGQPIGDRPTRIRGGPPNLRARELDAGAALASHRVDLEAAIDEIGAAIGADGVTSAGSRASELMDLAPPGIDELFGLLSVAESLTGSAPAEREPSTRSGSTRAASRVESLRSSAAPAAIASLKGRAMRAGVGPREPVKRSLVPGGGTPRALILIDTAPTGHALRLLELPDAAREWVQVLLRVLLKYRSLVRPGRLAAELVSVSKSIRELQALLTDRHHTRFIVVTRAAEVPRAETERLLDRLVRLRLATPAVVVNAMTLAPGKCPRCRATALAERRALAPLARRCRRRSRGCAIIQAPLVAPPPRGATALDRWAGTWTKTGPAAQSL